MESREEILQRIQRINEALRRAAEYLATGEHSDWYAFRPLFGDAKKRPPHRDWIRNVFIPRREKGLERCEKMLAAIDAKEKQRQISRRRQ
jgi:hypothetical protein